jgi:Neuraminidase-like domain/Salmonella virulence plasmid 28.1kDa A protein
MGTRSDHPLVLDVTGQKVEWIQDGLELMGYELPAAERSKRRYGASTDAAVRDLAARSGPWPEATLDEHADAAVKAAVAAVTPSGRVGGRISFDYGLPASGIDVLVYSRGFGGEDRFLVRGRTDSAGAYALGYARGRDPVNLEIRTVDPAEHEIPLSEPKFGAAVDETLDLVAPASVRPLAPEYERLTADLERVIGAASNFGGASESGGRRDLSVVARATGWDARLLALAAMAAKVSDETKVPAEALYGLFRVGLATEPEQLFRLQAKVVENAWRRASAAGIIKLSSARTAAARKAFRAHARAALGDVRAPGAGSSFGELVDAVKLPPEERAAWEDAYLSGATGRELFTAARRRGVSVEGVDKLRIQGKLALLTANNAPLAASLQSGIRGHEDLSGLVDEGLYRADTWKKRVTALAGSDAELGKLIPPAYAGDAPADRLDAYAADMARKVRIAFPTHVVGHRLEQGDLQLERGAETGTLLRTAAAQGFALGRTPVDAFFNAKGKALLGPDIDGSHEALLGAVKTLARVYQITPGDEAMETMLAEGFDSAQDVVDVERDTFIARYGEKLGEDAPLVYRKAEQVAGIAQASVANARLLDSAPVHVISGDHARVEAAKEIAKETLVKHYPTMEHLFGSLDFCECEHCRSVLGPAAYLVDLLRFLDPKQKTWEDFVESWNATHETTFPSAPDAPSDYDKPYDQLVRRRRPDIPNLPLTCENTNTLLPYIDLVNEILEYYVASLGYTGHDTGDSASRDLLAEPEHVLREAYAKLEGARYPIGLPFDLWLETVRAFLAQLDVPLWRLLETFRATDELFRPPNDPVTPYFRSQIFVESLGLSPAEWALFTRGAGPGWWDLYGYTSGQTAESALDSAKTLAKRLGVTYRELTELVRTSFVNPGLAALGLLGDLGIGLDEVYRFEKNQMSDTEKSAFTKLLDDYEQRTRFDAKRWLHDRYADGTLNRALVLAAPALECNFEQTRFQHAGGTKATAVDFVKLNLFVRLWRKLGWTIEELDRALTPLMPTKSPTAGQLGKALGTALIHLAHLNALADVLPAERRELPALWTDISTTGKSSLYARHFLTPAAKKADPVFDHPTGEYLSDPNVHLVDHRAALQAALTLSARDLDRIAGDAGLALVATPLSVANVSVLYRYRWLAGTLGMSIDDLITLKSLSGLDPFKPLGKPLDPNRPSPLADDHPFSQTLRFVELARLVGASGFTLAELDYLLRHRFDPAGPHSPDRQALLALVVDLGPALARIRADNAPPESLDDETLRQKLALVLPAEPVETFMGMWRGTIQYEAVKEQVAATDQLAPAGLPPAISLAYDSVAQVQRLTFTGVLRATDVAAIAPNPGLLRTLLDDVRTQAHTFYADHLTSFLPAADDFDVVFQPLPAPPAGVAVALAAKRGRLAERLFPYVQERLTETLIVGSRASALAADAGLVEALLTERSLLSDRDVPDRPLLHAFAAAADAGATASFYDATGAGLRTRDVVNVDTTSKPPGGIARSARLEGVLVVPETGTYTFFVSADDTNTKLMLRFAHLPAPVVAATASAANREPNGVADLKAGVAYSYALEIGELGTGDVGLLVQGATLPKGPLRRLELHPAAAVERVRRADAMLAKALRLMAGCGLDEREIRYFSKHRRDFDRLSLSALPAEPIKPRDAVANFAWFVRLAQYAALKRDLGLAGDELIDVFENARRTYDPGTVATDDEAALFGDLATRVARLMRREPAVVAETATALGFTANAGSATGSVLAADYADEQGLRRLWDALHMIETLGVAPGAIARWTKVVDPGATTAAREQAAQDVRSSLKARFTDDDWPAVVQPISDVLRRRKRDALVAFILADTRHDFQRPDELYEYFLVDPSTEPIVQTSRLQLAVSSVQLFVQRCLLNLEPRVPAAAIGSGDAKAWEWMKRYRLWEANRKIFLYPENWLEPEFRDEKTSLFVELEGALLQGDVSDDAAEDACLRYLNGLEQIARLQIVSMYAEERPGPTSTLHVIGRTFAAPHRYHYRRYANSQWSPWEPVGVEIEGDHVAAAVWRGRLHLFWVTFRATADNTEAHVSVAGRANKLVSGMIRHKVEIRLRWSECVRGEWTAPAAGPLSTFIERDVKANFDSSHVLVFVAKQPTLDGGEALLVVMTGDTSLATADSNSLFGMPAAFRLATKNSPPVAVPLVDSLPVNAFSSSPYGASPSFAATRQVYASKDLSVDFGTYSDIPPGPILGATPSARYELLLTDNALTRPDPHPALLAPFFYADEHHTFFVEPGETEPSITDWDEWVPDPPILAAEVPESLIVQAEVPDLYSQVSAVTSGFGLYTQIASADWVTTPMQVIDFGDIAIHQYGGEAESVQTSSAATAVVTGNGHLPIVG